MAESYIRGHKIIFSRIFKQWVYADTMKPITQDERACIRCGKSPTAEGHDNCLGRIKEVKYACCGHGITNEYFINMG